MRLKEIFDLLFEKLYENCRSHCDGCEFRLEDFSEHTCLLNNYWLYLKESLDELLEVNRITQEEYTLLFQLNQNKFP